MIVPVGIFLVAFAFLIRYLWRNASYTEELTVTIKRGRKAARIVARLKYDIIKLEAIQVREKQYQCVLYSDEIEHKYRFRMDMYRQLCDYISSTQPDICIIEIVR